MISLVTTPPAPSVPPWTVRSGVEAGFRLGLENFTAFAVTALLFTAPSFVLEMRGVGGIPKFAADILGNTAALICILCAAFEAMAGHPPGVQTTLWQIQRPALGKVLILGTVQAILIALGLFVLVAPGLYLMTIWAVAMPVLLMEEKDIVESFRQSAALTSGRRWRVVGVVAACIAAVLLTFGLLSLVLRIIPIMAERDQLRTMVLWPVSAIVATFLYPVPAVLYVLLRQDKEGLTVEEIVEPFY
jgi:hypothetical protein